MPSKFCGPKVQGYVSSHPASLLAAIKVGQPLLFLCSAKACRDAGLQLAILVKKKLALMQELRF